MTFSDPQQKQFTEAEKTTFTKTSEKTLTYSVKENIQTEIIYITEDKLKNYLRDYSDISMYSGLVIGFTGIAFTLIITLVTVSEYEERFSIKPPVWEAIFILSAAAVSILAIVFFIKWLNCRKELKLENMIKKIKGL